MRRASTVRSGAKRCSVRLAIAIVAGALIHGYVSPQDCWRASLAPGDRARCLRALPGVPVHAGVLMLGATAWGGNTRRAVPLAISAALGTTVYSLSDKAAVVLLPTFTAQIGYVSATYLMVWIAYTCTLRVRTGRWYPTERPRPLVWLSGALCIGTAYALVIYAMRSIPAAYVVTLSNGGILLAAVLSILFFQESERWQARLLSNIVVAAGLAMVGMAAA